MLRVKEICKEKNISLKELAEKIGVSPSSLTQSISGNPSLDKVLLLSQALDVPVSILVGDMPEHNTSTKCPHCGGSISFSINIK